SGRDQSHNGGRCAVIFLRQVAMSESADRRLEEARNEVRQVCDWLMRPSAETMEACAPALDRAIAQIRELSAHLPAADTNPQLIQVLTALAGEIRSTKAL